MLVVKSYLFDSWIIYVRFDKWEGCGWRCWREGVVLVCLLYVEYLISVWLVICDYEYVVFYVFLRGIIYFLIFVYRNWNWELVLK